jgi:1-acyl-sn-glycerol-3-phosphate acyltransferase
VQNARWRLACLDTSQTAIVLADFTLRGLVWMTAWQAGSGTAWYAITALLVLPALILAPINGAVIDALPKRRVLAASAGFFLLVVLVFTWLAGIWLECLIVAAVGTTLFRLTLGALLPAAATDGHLPLMRVNARIDMAAGPAMIAGLVFGVSIALYGNDWQRLEKALGWLPGWGAWAAGHTSEQVAGWSAAGLGLVGFSLAWLVWFPSDAPAPWLRRPLRQFLQHVSLVLKDRETRSFLFGLAIFRGLVAIAAGVLLSSLSAALLEPTQFLEELASLGFWLGAGILLGSFLAGVQTHPWRSQGVAPFGAVGLLVGLAVAALEQSFSPGICFLLGTMGGLVNVPLAAAYQDRLPAGARGNGMAVCALFQAMFVGALSAGMYLVVHYELLTLAQQFWIITLLAAIFAILTWRWFFRPAMEFMVEWLAWLMYRIRAQGPGLDSFPRRGPVLVVANHSCWFDPVFIAKVLPRRLTAMMTSQFYDKALLRWFARHVVHAIRVQASVYRHEAPELAKAIAELDRGDGVLIFPEGAMRRREALPLKLFGQGIWHILSKRPQTPVVVCWIEGNWGSYFSYRGGPPTVNKRFDFWRRIDIAVEPPLVVDQALLADHRETRKFLMHKCLEARRHLGLEPLRPEVSAEEKEMGDEPKSL